MLWDHLRLVSVGVVMRAGQLVRRDRTGHRVDDSYVERLIGASRKPGRPSLAENGPSPSIALRVPASVRKQAEAIAAKEGNTVSQLAREALEARLAAS